jgi:hypothetical protein
LYHAITTRPHHLTEETQSMAHTQSGYHARKRRQEEAAARNADRVERTDDEQLFLLMERPGASAKEAQRLDPTLMPKREPSRRRKRDRRAPTKAERAIRERAERGEL